MGRHKSKRLRESAVSSFSRRQRDSSIAGFRRVVVRAGLTRWSAYVLLLFNQLIGFVNGDIRSFFFARTNPALCDHLASRHRQRQGSQREKAGDQHVRQLGGFRDLSAAQPQWSRPQQRCHLLSIPASPDARLAALIGGSVDATVVNSPFESRRAKRLCGIALDQRDRRVRQPINALSTSQRKIGQRAR